MVDILAFKATIVCLRAAYRRRPLYALHYTPLYHATSHAWPELPVTPQPKPKLPQMCGRRKAAHHSNIGGSINFSQSEIKRFSTQLIGVLGNNLEKVVRVPPVQL